MRTRKHTNNDGRRQIKRGKTHRQVTCIASRLKAKFDDGPFGRIDKALAS